MPFDGSQLGLAFPQSLAPAAASASPSVVVFPSSLDTQATAGASEHCKDNLHSRGCKCGFQDPAAPGSPPVSFILPCYPPQLWLCKWKPWALVSNQLCGEGWWLRRSHRLHLWLRISPQSRASERAWGEWISPLPAWGPWHWGVTAATPLQNIPEQPRKNSIPGNICS